MSNKNRSLIPVLSLTIILAFIAAVLAAEAVFAAEAPNSQYSLKGAKYQLYTDEACKTKAKDINGNNALLTTDADGNTTAIEMKAGTYYAKEETPGKGYKLDTDANGKAKVYTVKVTVSKTKSDPAVFTSKEPPVAGEPDFRVFKTDPDRAFSYDKLKGAKFTIKYYDVAAKKDIANATPRKTWTFTTVKKDAPEEAPAGTYWAGFDWQTDKAEGDSFYTLGGKRVIPLGWFTIEESVAPKGFKLTDKVYYGHVSQDGTGGDAVTEISGSKKDSRLKVETLIFEDTAHRTSVKKTDSSTGKALAGAKLQILQGNVVKEEWTTTAAEHVINGLAPGTYTLREVSAPYGYDLADDISFTVKEDQDTSVEMKNTPVTLATTASGAAGKHVGAVRKDFRIKDKVHVTGLHTGRKYRVSGSVVDKSSGNTVKTSTGSAATASKDFTATAASMDIEMEFSVDSSAFRPGDRTVVYETLHRISAVHGEAVPAELQKHQNLNDAAQTIVYPGISTVASDKVSASKNMLAAENAVITDTVSYKGLVPGDAYTIEGELFDKTSGSMTGVRSSQQFTAAAETGTVSMDFSFNASGMKNHTLVVYETLKCGDEVLVSHKDPGDAAQTVYVPEIGTTASLRDGNHEVRDVITYANLLPDCNYIFKGWLVDTVTGEKVPGSDGSATLATGKKTSGSIEMKLDPSKYDDMNGHSMTAFEELYITAKKDGADREFKVAEHKDVNSESQTVEIYQDIKIKKNVTGNLGDLTKSFAYTAEFTGLVPGESYTIEGDDEKVFNADKEGRAKADIKLSDDRQVTIKQIPKSAEYRITEEASDHVAGYKVYSEDMEGKGAKIVKIEGSNAEDAAKALATELEKVDMFDGTVVVLWHNNRDLATVTSVRSYLDIWAFATAAALGAVLLLLHRRKALRVWALVLAAAITLSAAPAASAVSGAIDSDRTDYITNRTGNSTAVRQSNSSDKGTVRLGKILTVNQSGKFPNIEDFVFKITPVAAWDNANESTEKSGKKTGRESMPCPEASSLAHHRIVRIAPDSTGDSPWTALVTVGDFRNGAESNSSGIYGDRQHRYVNSDHASNIEKIDEDRRRTRVTDVAFRFDKAGYYMYKVEEAGSSQNGSTDSLSGLRKDVPGVDYDDNTYYIVFYVCNRQAETDAGADEYGHGDSRGDTKEGVYVHTITSWTNSSENAAAGRKSTDYRPDNSMRTSDRLADIRNRLNDLMQNQDVDRRFITEYGDGDHDAEPNTGRAGETVTHDNAGKVGISTPYDPDYLEAYRMWNAQLTHDVVLKKTVTGNLGDRSKKFIFEVTLAGLEANQTYTTDVPAGSTDGSPDAGTATNDVTSPGAVMYEMDPPSALSEDGKSFTTDGSGEVSFKVGLKDGELLVLNALPRTASYRIKEQASDHVAQYNIVSTNRSGENKAVFTEKNHSPGGRDPSHLGTANGDANRELSTEVEYVDRYDGTVTVIFRNDRDLATLTGVAGLDIMTYAAAMALISVPGAAVVRRRREYAREDAI